MRVYELTDTFAFGDMPDAAPLVREFDVVVTLSKKKPTSEILAVIKEWHYLWIPDGKRVPLKELEQIVALVRAALAQNKRVLVHCYGGRNRSGLVAALVCMEELGISGKEALAMIDEVALKRNGTPRALTNIYYRRFLEFAEERRNDG